MNMGFGNTAAVGGAYYGVVFVNRTTCYNWMFSLDSLAKEDIKTVFEIFCVEVGRVAK